MAQTSHDSRCQCTLSSLRAYNSATEQPVIITYVAREVVARALAVELAEAVADVAAGLVVGHELLGLEAVGAGVAHVDTRHNSGGKKLCDAAR